MKKNSTPRISSLDRQEVTNLIETINKLDGLDLVIKKQILDYLLKIVNLSFDVEHSKITISKLQKIFGFSPAPVNKAKEV